MTLPIEKYSAMMSAKRFLRALLDPKETPRVPREVREQARRVLKHYPAIFEIAEMEQAEREQNPSAPDFMYRDYERNPIDHETEGY